MLIIDSQSDLVSKILSEQTINKTKIYRKLSYIREINMNDGYLLFNLFTGEMLLIDSVEKEKFLSPADLSDETVLNLIKKWYLVPTDNNDYLLLNQMTLLLQQINSIYTAPKINNFTILPTTDCNARCFYCYEHGCEKKFMSLKTADDVVSYVLKNRDESIINLRWFGGEPLYNVSVIDHISQKMTENNVDFVSRMVSNGYLFDDDMIRRAKEIWKLHSIQITIDGTEDVYNRVKAYIYKNDVSPFKRVIDNAEKLIKSGVRVDFRLNMDNHNIEDLFQLSDYLLERFNDYDNYQIYPHLLYSYAQRPIGEYDEEYLNKKFIELKTKLSAKTIKFKEN